MKRHSIFLQVLSLLFVINAMGQSGSPVTDSLKALYGKATHDTTRVVLLQNIGLSHYRQGNFTEASSSYFKALEIAERLRNETLMSGSYQGIATVYFAEKDLDKALEYNQKALAIRLKTGDKKGAGSSMANIGAIYFEKNDTANANIYLNRALKVFQEAGNKKGQAAVYTQLGVLHGPDHARSLGYKLAAQRIWDEIDPMHHNSVMNTGNIGVTYFDIVRYDSLHLVKPGPDVPAGRDALLAAAEKYIRKAIDLSEQTGDVNGVMLFTGDLASVKAEQKQFATAFEELQKYNRLYDSIYSQENKNQIAAIESRKEMELKDQAIAINKLELANERKNRWFFIAGIFVLVLAGIFLYRQSRNRKRTNTTLMVLNNQLDEANKVKARFFAILSHDLRSPVANLVSFLELQQDHPGLLTPQESQEHQQAIRRSAKALLENMESMLLWSKEQMKNFKPDLRPVPVKDLFAYIENSFRDSRVRISFHSPEGMMLNTDENYLQTIMHNLTSNAVKALYDNPEGRIDWKAREENGKILLSVSDNGPGISKEQVSVLDDELISVTNAKTGLGLHLVRDLAKAIRYTVSMNSSPGKGTTFTLSGM